MSGKRKLNHDEAVLELVLEPPSTPAKKPRLGAHHPRLRADARNCVAGIVNGVACRVVMDSGTNITCLHWNMAKRMGLITGAEATTTTLMTLWSGPEVLQVVELPNVTISLGPGVEVATPAIVLPQWLQRYYEDPKEVLLDAHQMRRGRMVQVFRPDGSDLLVRKPEWLKRRARKSDKSFRQYVLQVREAHTTNVAPMTMLVDTGADNIYVSERRLRLLTQADKRRSPPDRVRLDTGDGCRLHDEPLGQVPLAMYDFIMGIAPLGKYGAVLDHAAHKITLQVGSQWRKMQMQPCY